MFSFGSLRDEALEAEGASHILDIEVGELQLVAHE